MRLFVQIAVAFAVCFSISLAGAQNKAWKLHTFGLVHQVLLPYQL